MRDDSVLDRRGPRLEDISMSGVWLRRSATCSLMLCALLLRSATVGRAQSQSAPSNDRCGDVVTLQTHDRSTTRYAYVPPPRSSRVVTVVGGPGYPGPPGVSACEGRAPHGFLDQEAEVAVGIARFVRGGDY
jgi:hypothetical protein